jgi:hypothetical protein
MGSTRLHRVLSKAIKRGQDAHFFFFVIIPHLLKHTHKHFITMKFQGSALLCLALFLLVTFAQAQSSAAGGDSSASSGGSSASASGSGSPSDASGSSSGSGASSSSSSGASSGAVAFGPNMAIQTSAVLGAFALGSAFVLA